MNIAEAATKLTGANWNCRNGVLEQAEDGTPRVALPSTDALKTAMESDLYAEKRLSEYPSIGDQLDALWKDGKAAEDMRAKVLAVKAKYPKPE